MVLFFEHLQDLPLEPGLIPLFEAGVEKHNPAFGIDDQVQRQVLNVEDGLHRIIRAYVGFEEIISEFLFLDELEGGLAPLVSLHGDNGQAGILVLLPDLLESR